MDSIAHQFLLSRCRPCVRNAFRSFRSTDETSQGRKRRPGSVADGTRLQMIVCSCNVLSDHDVRNAVNGSRSLPRNAKQLYGCLGCSTNCGRCARTINTIIEEAHGPCVKASSAGCPSQEAASRAKTRALDRALRES